MSLRGFWPKFDFEIGQGQILYLNFLNTFFKLRDIISPKSTSLPWFDLEI
jgi:hypothetical protein